MTNTSAGEVPVSRWLQVLVTASLLAALAVASLPAGQALGAPKLDEIEIVFETFVDELEEPVFATLSGDGSGDIYVVGGLGRIWIVKPDGTKVEEPFLDISDRVVWGGEQALVGLAFHPDYPSNGRFFVVYARNTDSAVIVSEFNALDGPPDPAAERILLEIPKEGKRHNGGTLAFDRAGMLLIGIGDDFDLELDHSRDPLTLQGGILRIDVDGEEPYAIPEDNPFVSDPAFLPEVFAYGLRNPYRFWVDETNGNIYIGEVGDLIYEEINILPEAGGLYFGWSDMEGPRCAQHIGTCDPTLSTAPVLAYLHKGGGAVVGGLVYRGDEEPGLKDVYVFGDFVTGEVFGAPLEDMEAGAAAPVRLGAWNNLEGLIYSFFVDAEDSLYVVIGAGSLERIRAVPRGTAAAAAKESAEESAESAEDAESADE